MVDVDTMMNVGDENHTLGIIEKGCLKLGGSVYGCIIWILYSFNSDKHKVITRDMQIIIWTIMWASDYRVLIVVMMMAVTILLWPMIIIFCFGDELAICLW